MSELPLRWARGPSRGRSLAVIASSTVDTTDFRTSVGIRGTTP